jgi:hypothetical protein
MGSVGAADTAADNSAQRGIAMKRRRSWTSMTVVTAGFALGIAGCATTAKTETLLSQAGFRQIPADTPQKLGHLKTLPERRLVGRTSLKNGKEYYVYADPDGCKCLYIGDPKQYQDYRRLAQQQAQVEGQDVREAREWEEENSGR